jgi:hypothetical protein
MKIGSDVRPPSFLTSLQSAIFYMKVGVVVDYILVSCICSIVVDLGPRIRVR